MDRAYVDFERLFVFTLCSSFFVVRTNKNILLQRRYSHPVDKSTGLRSDQTVILTAIESAQAYPDSLRRVSYFDAATNKRLKFLTNNFALPALTIAEIYRSRWQVELFFRWIKQHLRIKKFYGTSENAVKTQVWIAVSVYVLVAIVRKRLGLEASLYQILQILSVTLFEKTPILPALQPSASHENLLDAKAKYLESSPAVLPVQKAPFFCGRSRALPRSAQVSEQRRGLLILYPCPVVPNDDPRPCAQLVLLHEDIDIGSVRIEAVPDQLGKCLDRLRSCDLLKEVTLHFNRVRMIGHSVQCPFPKQSTH